MSRRSGSRGKPRAILPHDGKATGVLALQNRADAVLRNIGRSEQAEEMNRRCKRLQGLARYAVITGYVDFWPDPPWLRCSFCSARAGPFALREVTAYSRNVATFVWDVPEETEVYALCPRCLRGFETGVLDDVC